MSSWYEFEDREGEDSDVLLFDELRRQVLQLTADDEEELQESHCPNKERGFTNSNSSSSVLQIGFQFEWTGNMDTISRVPQWLIELWRTENNKGEMTNGTGVFIPHIVNTRRRYKPRKKNNGRGRVYKPVIKIN